MSTSVSVLILLSALLHYCSSLIAMATGQQHQYNHRDQIHEMLNTFGKLEHNG